MIFDYILMDFIVEIEMNLPKRPLTGFTMFYKLKNKEILSKYLSAQNMPENSIINKFNELSIISEAWKNENNENKETMRHLANEYNKDNNYPTLAEFSEYSKKYSSIYIAFCKCYTNNNPEFYYNTYRQKKWNTIVNNVEDFKSLLNMIPDHYDELCTKLHILLSQI
jgi:type III secretory pathway component EscR